MDQQINGSIDRWISRSMDQWISRSMDQWISRSMDQWISRSMDLWINRSMDLWINRSMDQQINGSIDRWISRSIDQWISRSMDKIEQNRNLYLNTVILSNLHMLLLNIENLFYLKAVRHTNNRYKSVYVMCRSRDQYIDGSPHRQSDQRIDGLLDRWMTIVR